PETVVARLEEVGCTVEVNGDVLTVVPPTWRSDLTMAADLVEEVLRLEGLEAIPTIVPTAPAGRGLSDAQKRRRAVGHAQAYVGYCQISPSHFMKPVTFDVWGLHPDHERRNTVTVLKQLEADSNVLSTTLLPDMLAALRLNFIRCTGDFSHFGGQQVSF